MQPQAADERDVRAVAALITCVCAAGKKVYVHCKAGRGRSACLVCCYLIVSGELV